MVILIAFVHGLLLIVIVGNILHLRRPRVAHAAGEEPRVSVLIPARNEEKNLRRLIPSLLSQRYPSFEVVVYDDGSEDRTWETLESFRDPRLKPLRGSGPPAGWVGKVHALYQATRAAEGGVYLFLDADAHMDDDLALRRVVDLFSALPEHSVLTGQTRLQGGGLLLVSLVPHAILSGIPWFMAERLPFRSLGALNGQCWMIEADAYHRHEPHQNLPGEVLEDVQIGRYLKERGVSPVLVDVQDEVSVFMYADFASAWQGFRKNAYLILGGTPWLFVPLFLFFLFSYVLAPFFSPWFLLSIYLLKRLTDRASGFPPWISLLAPVSFALGAILQLHSAVSHWTGRVQWKGRQVV